MFDIIADFTKTIENIIVDYIDVDFTLWLSWLLMPLLVTFLLPMVIAVLFYVTALILYIYKLHRAKLRHAYGTDWKNAARNLVAAVWDAHGWIFHGYEIVGLENIPKDKPVLFIYYHGAIPIDLYYFISKVFLFNSKLIHTVADRFLFKLPGWGIISNVLKVIPGTIQTCSNILKEGNSLAISPGGVYEAQFGDCYYQLMWKRRLGFAKVALDAKVASETKASCVHTEIQIGFIMYNHLNQCIIPIFTKNLREAFRTVSWGRRMWLRLYAVTRFPLVPIYGGFPVKLKTFVGTPIPYDDTLTPDELQIKVASALEDLIKEHQVLPGSITRALLERVYDPSRSKKS